MLNIKAMFDLLTGRKPAAGNPLQTVQIDTPPLFYSSFDLSVRQLADGRWVVSNGTWQAGVVRDNPEEAIIAMWRMVYAHGGVAAMNAVSEKLTKRQRDARSN